MLEKEVDGYVLKEIERNELIKAIKIIYNGDKYFNDKIMKQIEKDNKIKERQRTTGTMLTLREQEVLSLIAENYTNAEIAEKLFLSKRTIEHHRESILEKLEVKKASQLIKKAKELNLIRD